MATTTGTEGTRRTAATGPVGHDRLHLADDPAGNAILADNPFALLVGMQLDQQIPMEKAFSGPAVLRERFGGEFTPARVAAASPAAVEEACAQRPAVHRFPRAVATRLHALARMIVDEYAGDPAAIWTTAASGDELVARITALPGFGDQKARIFTALLAKQFGVTPRGWKKAAGDYGRVGFRSVADVVDATSLQRVREHKKAVKAAARAAVAGASGDALPGEAKVRFTTAQSPADRRDRPPM